MDGVSAAASIIGVANAGLQVSIKLVTLASQIRTAPQRISAIADDISLTSGILHQLADLINHSVKNEDGKEDNIFSAGGLQTAQALADTCIRLFEEIENDLKKASQQIGSRGVSIGKRIALSRFERVKWPFLQPRMDELRSALGEAKSTLMLVLQVTTLAYSRKTASMHVSEFHSSSTGIC